MLTSYFPQESAASYPITKARDKISGLQVLIFFLFYLFFIFPASIVTSFPCIFSEGFFDDLRLGPSP